MVTIADLSDFIRSRDPFGSFLEDKVVISQAMSLIESLTQHGAGSPLSHFGLSFPGWLLSWVEIREFH